MQKEIVAAAGVGDASPPRRFMSAGRIGAKALQLGPQPGPQTPPLLLCKASPQPTPVGQDPPTGQIAPRALLIRQPPPDHVRVHGDGLGDRLLDGIGGHRLGPIVWVIVWVIAWVVPVSGRSPDAPYRVFPQDAQ